MKTHVLDIRVRYGDTDRAGVVYYANYFHYFEIGRTEYLRALGAPYRCLEERGVLFVVVEATCRYMAPAGYDDDLQVVSWVDRLRPTRVDFRTLVVRKGQRTPIAEGHVVLACVDRERRPLRVPVEIADRVVLCDGPPWAATDG